MTEQAPQREPNVLVVYRRDIDQETFKAIGESAAALGCGIEYRAIDNMEPVVVEAQETQSSTYASLFDFEQAAVQINMTEATGTRAWRVLARQYVRAYNAPQTQLISFGHAPVKPGAKLSYDDLREIDVRSLAEYVAPINALIAKVSGWRAKELLNNSLPPGAGAGSFAVWNTVVQNMLSPTEESTER
jgi:hypothetical protein